MLKEDRRGRAEGHWCHTLPRVHALNTSVPIDADRGRAVSFLLGDVTAHPPPCHTLSRSLEESHSAQPTPGVGESWSPPWGQSTCVNPSESFCLEIRPFSCVCSFAQWMVSINIDSRTLVSDFGRPSPPSFCCSNCPVFGGGSSSSWPVPRPFGFERGLIFWDEKLQAHPVCFLPQPQIRSAVSPRSPGAFCWKVLLDTQTWALGMLAAWVWLLPGPLGRQSRELSVRALTWA